MRCALRLQAANPGAVMEDFVRWHSPRDWIEEEIMTPEGRKIEGINRFRPEMVTFFFSYSSRQKYQSNSSETHRWHR